MVSPPVEITCPDCSTKYRFPVPPTAMANPDHPMRFRCSVCELRFDIQPIDFFLDDTSAIAQKMIRVKHEDGLRLAKDWQTVQSWIKQGEIQGTEPMSAMGGSWRKVATHTEVAEFFPDFVDDSPLESADDSVEVSAEDDVELDSLPAESDVISHEEANEAAEPEPPNVNSPEPPNVNSPEPTIVKPQEEPVRENVEPSSPAAEHPYRDIMDEDDSIEVDSLDSFDSEESTVVTSTRASVSTEDKEAANLTSLPEDDAEREASDAPVAEEAPAIEKEAEPSVEEPTPPVAVAASPADTLPIDMEGDFAEPEAEEKEAVDTGTPSYEEPEIQEQQPLPSPVKPVEEAEDSSYLIDPQYLNDEDQDFLDQSEEDPFSGLFDSLADDEDASFSLNAEPEPAEESPATSLTEPRGIESEEASTSQQNESTLFDVPSEMTDSDQDELATTLFGGMLFEENEEEQQAVQEEGEQNSTEKDDFGFSMEEDEELSFSLESDEDFNLDDLHALVREVTINEFTEQSDESEDEFNEPIDPVVVVEEEDDFQDIIDYQQKHSTQKRLIILGLIFSVAASLVIYVAFFLERPSFHGLIFGGDSSTESSSQAQAQTVPANATSKDSKVEAKKPTEKAKEPTSEPPKEPVAKVEEKQPVATAPVKEPKAKEPEKEPDKKTSSEEVAANTATKPSNEVAKGEIPEDEFVPLPVPGTFFDESKENKDAYEEIDVPENPRVLSRQGWIALNNEEIARSLDFFALALRSDPQNIEALYGTGFALEKRVTIDVKTRPVNNRTSQFNNRQLNQAVNHYCRLLKVKSAQPYIISQIKGRLEMLRGVCSGS